MHGKKPPSEKVAKVLTSVNLSVNQSVKQKVDTPKGNSYNDLRAEVAQSVEQRTENPRVPSSILGLGTKKERK